MSAIRRLTVKVRLDQRTRVPRVPGWVTVIVLAWLSAVALLAMLSRVYGTPTVPCHFRSITGVPCATCGSTRAGIAALEGRVLDALLINPLVMAVAMIAALVLGVRFLTARQIVVRASTRERVALLIVGAAAFAANWLYVIARHAADAAAVPVH